MFNINKIQLFFARILEDHVVTYIVITRVGINMHFFLKCMNYMSTWMSLIELNSMVGYVFYRTSTIFN